MRRSDHGDRFYRRPAAVEMAVAVPRVKGSEVTADRRGALASALFVTALTRIEPRYDGPPKEVHDVAGIQSPNLSSIKRQPFAH